MLNKPKILIVDDIRENIYSIKKIISEIDAEIFSAENGNEALSLCLTNDFAVILLDVNMPDIDGYEVAKILRDNNETVHIPIIFITADYVTDENIFKGYESGGIDYITKPVIPFILLGKIRVFMELYKFNQMKSFEQELKLFELTPAMIWRAGTNAECNYFNNAWLKFTGRKYNEELGDGWAEGVHKDDFDNCVKVYLDKFNKRESFELEYRLRNYKGEYRWIIDYGRPYIDENGDFSGYIGYCFDIEDKKANQLLLIESENRFKNAIINSPLPIMIHAENGEVLLLSKAWTDITDYTIAEIPNTNIWNKKAFRNKSGKDKKAINDIYNINERINEGEITITTKNGKERIWNISTSPLGNLPDGRKFVISMALDVTLNKIMEDEIIRSLKEKTLLLQEVHHRVKNNLQIISSLLALEKSKFDNNEILNSYQESENRIKVMAMLHEILYRTNDFSKINLSEYVHTIINNLYDSYGISESIIKNEINIDNIDLNINSANPLGLMINEMVSNSFKYAFPDNRPGKIFIKIIKLDTEKYEMTAGDDGIGFKNEKYFEDYQTLGLQLIYGLSSQMKAQISLNTVNGSVFKIEFNQNRSN